MSKKELSDDDLEEELEKALKENELRKDKCGAALSSSKEVGIQRSNVKLKENK
ncbi:MAG: hypothetical protein ACTSQG_08580 [Promethearchaeota archaeon]